MSAMLDDIISIAIRKLGLYIPTFNSLTVDNETHDILFIYSLFVSVLKKTVINNILQ